MAVSKAVQRWYDLNETLDEGMSGEKDDIILEEFISRTALDICEEFPNGSDWFNVETPLSLTDLQGKVVLLDFFTYCCINCMHILPDLHELESLFPVSKGFIIVGVHSAKFPAEKSNAGLKAAIERYSIEHAIVNDTSAAMWNSMGVSCWPTLVILSPKSEVLFALAGEGHKDLLIKLVEKTLNYYSSVGELNVSRPIKVTTGGQSIASSVRFPGKVCRSIEGFIVVSDSGQHRLLLLDANYNILKIIGCGKKGCKDGDINSSCFSSPQGVCIHGDQLYVADTGNNVIRLVNLKENNVSTLPSLPLADSSCFTQCSPWDVCLGPSPGSVHLLQVEEYDALYVAMAGIHQIWACSIKDQLGWKKQEHAQGTWWLVAGNGREENRNNSYPLKAGFAQPSGLSLRHEEGVAILYIADSESSTVRSLDLQTGAVKNVVGGEIDPTNLFGFGDLDGIRTSARLQHPVAVAWSGHSLLVADTYNHKLKAVDPNSRRCDSLELKIEAIPGTLAEPNGLCMLDADNVLVTDSNNHRLLNLNLFSSTCTLIEICMPPVDVLDDPDGTDIECTEFNVDLAQAVELELILQLPNNTKLTDEAPSSWILTDESQGIRTETELKELKTVLKIMTGKPIKDRITIENSVTVYYCAIDDGVCKRFSKSIKLLLVNTSGSSSYVPLTCPVK